MAEKCTVIRLKRELQDPRFSGGSYGWLDYGEKTFEHMFADIRRHAQVQVDIGQAILAAKPEDFQCQLVRGSMVQHKIKDIFPNEV